MYDGLRDERRWVLPEVLRFQAETRPHAPFLIAVSDGATLTYAEAADQAERVAGFFAGLGVTPGEPVALLLPNGFDFVRVWLGLMRLGAVVVALNTELKGAFLAHQLADTGCRLAVVDAERLERVAEVAERLPALEILVSDAAAEQLPPRLRAVPLSAWREATPWNGPLPAAADTACIMYTSGTTGPAKGVLMPQAHCFLFGLGTIDNFALTPVDRFYICLPLFHANGLFMQLGATLIAGASAALRERFSASAWIADIRRVGATASNLLGAVTAFILAQPPAPDDRDHRLRVVGAAPDAPAHDAALRDRFGIADVVPLYGMTEVNIPLYGELGVPRPGTCGKVYARYFEVEVRDPETDQALPPGSVGEIMVRPKAAFGFTTGYHGMPEKTVEAWRNLWFHTGDAAVMDDEGYVVFVDRIKDSIRRRGENISSFEVEAAIERLAGIAEVAAYAVPAGIEGGEDEIMLAVVAAPGTAVTEREIAAHAEKELPRYAQPRFIELLPELPKTPTGKVQKAALRRRGVTAATWDNLGPA